jgi:hypothetical protein
MLFSLKGIEKLRQVHSLPYVTYNHILELEHTDSWMVALQEYDSLQAIHSSRALAHSSSDEIATLAFIERGRFHCLYQLGQLEALIDQVPPSPLPLSSRPHHSNLFQGDRNLTSCA